MKGNLALMSDVSSPHIVLISSSLAQKSRSRMALAYAYDYLMTHHLSVDLIDMRDYPVQPYPHSKGVTELDTMVERFDKADGWVMGAPVYNWNTSGVLLNFLHYALSSRQRRYRPFVLVAGAGGMRAHLALDGLARTMVYEIAAVQVGPAILAAGAEADRETAYLDPALQDRLKLAMDALRYFAAASNALQREQR
jgi:NAD(P)H-dependent FMN reductase